MSASALPPLWSWEQEPKRTFSKRCVCLTSVVLVSMACYLLSQFLSGTTAGNNKNNNPQALVTSNQVTARTAAIPSLFNSDPLLRTTSTKAKTLKDLVVLCDHDNGFDLDALQPSMYQKRKVIYQKLSLAENIIPNSCDPQNLALICLAMDDQVGSYGNDQLLNRYVLIAMFFSLDGFEWNNNENWLTTSNECSWYGVTCIGAHITVLSLPGNNLEGSLTNALFLLPMLAVIDLSNNKITQGIPNYISNMMGLRTLSLQNNFLTGSLPTEIGLLKELGSLNLVNNTLDGPLPSEIGNMKALKLMGLGDNGFRGSLPHEIWDLISLEYLSIDRLNVSGIISPKIGTMRGLEVLQASHVLLEGRLPTEVGRLDSLKWLDVRNNNLEGSVPRELGTLRNFEFLALSQNAFQLPFPDEVCGFADDFEQFYVDRGACDPWLAN